MKYRKISIEVEAFQYNVDKEPEWFLKAVEQGCLLRKYCPAGDFIIKDGGTAYGMAKERFLSEYKPLKTYKKTYGRNDENGNLILPADDEDKDDDWS